MSEREAMFYEKRRGGGAACRLCPHLCEIPPGAAGRCGARRNAGGTLIAENFGKINAAALDPIEKKPLRLFRPGRAVLSVGSFGCNMDCPFCQNHESVRRRGGETRIGPAELAELAKRNVFLGNIGAAYTYNEPLVGYEYVLESAMLVREAGLENVLVTNGLISPEPLLALLPYMDAANIDLKCFSREGYEKLGGKLDTVLETIELAAARRRVHVEVTLLVVQGENERDAGPAAEWLAGISPDIPLHVSRFFPRHRYAGWRPTPARVLLRCVEDAQRHLRHVFAGNI